MMKPLIFQNHWLLHWNIGNKISELFFFVNIELILTSKHINMEALRRANIAHDIAKKQNKKNTIVLIWFCY